MMAITIDGFLSDLMKPLAVLFVFAMVVFFHELGHFLVARWCGVRVKAFSIGFGKEIIAFVDKHGTRWRFAWLPLGGYVKFMDDENPASVPSKDIIARMSPEERAGSFHAKPIWQRAAVVAAGPIANFLLAIVIFAIWFMVFGVSFTEPRVDEVVPDSPAARAGLRPGDLITEIAGTKIDSFERVKQVVTNNVGRELDVKIERNKNIEILKVTPEIVEQTDERGQKTVDVVIGIKRLPTPDTVTVHKPGPIEALWRGVEYTGYIIKSTLIWIYDVATGRHRLDQLGGVGRIADITTKVVDRSTIDVIYLIGFLSVGIGLLNLFPIPLLDGGHLVFYAIEAVRRKPLSERTMEMSFRFGFAVVLMLMMLAFYNDRFIYRDWALGLAKVLGFGA